MNQTTPSAYVPGVCNINREEISYRKKVGYIGLAIGVVLLVLLLTLPLSRYFRLILVLPAILSASGFLQAKNKFCVGYGAAGKQNAADGSKSASVVEDANALLKAKAKTSKINRQSVAIGLAVTLVCMLLPHL